MSTGGRRLGYELAATLWLATGLAAIIAVTTVWWWAVFLLSAVFAVFPLVPAVLFAAAGPLLVADVQAVRAVRNRAGLPCGAITVGDQEAPRLWEEIGELARELGTHVPARLVLIPAANAYVLERRRSWRRRSKRVLCVGIPLLVALSPAQQRAVLAHEIGHLAERHAPFTRLADRTVRMLRMLRAEIRHYDLPTSDIVMVNKLMRWQERLQHDLFSALLRLHQESTMAVRHRNELAADRMAVRAVGATTLRNALAEAGFASACWRKFHAAMTASAPDRRPCAEELFAAFRTELPVLRGNAATAGGMDHLLRARIAALTLLCAQEEPVTGSDAGVDFLLDVPDLAVTGVAASVLTELASKDHVSRRNEPRAVFEKQRLLKIRRVIKHVRIPPRESEPTVKEALDVIVLSRGSTPEAQALSGRAAAELSVDRWPSPLAFALAYGERSEQSLLSTLRDAVAAPDPNRARARLSGLGVNADLPLELGTDRRTGAGHSATRRWISVLAALGVVLCMMSVLSGFVSWAAPAVPLLLLLGIVTAPVWAILWAVTDTPPATAGQRSRLVQGWYRGTVGVLVGFTVISYALAGPDGLPWALVLLVTAIALLNPKRAEVSNRRIFWANMLAVLLMIGYQWLPSLL